MVNDELIGGRSRFMLYLIPLGLPTTQKRDAPPSRHRRQSLKKKKDKIGVKIEA